jgi:hypothetical protein
VTAPIHVVLARLSGRGESARAYIRLASVAVLLLYPILLLWTYREHVSPAYEGIGYPYHRPENTLIVVAGVFLAVLPALWLPLRMSRPGVLMVWMMYVLVYVPAQVIPIVGTDVDATSLLALQCALLTGFMILLLADRVPLIRVPRPVIAPRVFWIGFWLVYAASIATVVWYLRIPTALPTFGEVYGVRGIFIDRLSTFPTAVGYLHAWQGQVFNPFLIAYAVARRSYLAGAVGVLGQMYLYGTSGEKSVLFIVALIVGVYLALKLARSVVVPMIAVGASALILGSIALDAALNTNWFMALFIHRLTVIPGQLTGLYYEFFSSHPKAMLGHSVLSPIFDYPYDTTIPLLIGREVIGNPETVANANIWADGFANFGFAGIVLVSVIAGAVIWLFNALSLGNRYLLGTALAAGAALVWSNDSVFTAMLTHGIALTLLLLWMVPMERVSNSGRGVETS